MKMHEGVTPFMDRRQLLVICVCFCLMRLQATLTLGVMPVYVIHLGADAAATGLFMSFSFFGVTTGNMLGGWLSDRTGYRKRLALISYLLWIPAALQLTQATTVPDIILASGLMWLPGGVAIAALNSILGLSAGQNERGRVFGWVSLAGGTGALLAGLFGGNIAEQWGFPVLFVMMAALAGALLLLTFTIQDVTAQPNKRTLTQMETNAPVLGLGRLVYMLLLATLFAGLGPTVSDLGRPMVMLQYKMNVADVSNAIAFSAIVTLPLPIILGWLSDRVGRKSLLILFYGLSAAGILLLSVASATWHFWFSAALVSLINASGGVGQAFVTDLSDSNTIGRSLSLYTSSSFIAGMIGLGGAGLVMQTIGIYPTLLLGVFSLVTAILILLRMQSSAIISVGGIIDAAVSK